MVRVAEEAREEREKLAGIQARFNNTPLRRILRKQTNNPAYNEHVTFKGNPVMALTTPSKSLKKLEQNSNRLANSIDFDDAVVGLKRNSIAESETTTKLVVSSKGSPLRRIIQRQASGNVGARRQEQRV